MTLATVAGLAPGAAFARTSRLFESSFGSFPNEEQPTAVAVDQSTDDVYVASKSGESSSVSRFTAAGAPDDFTAGPGAGTNVLPVSNSTFEGVEDIAVDNSGGSLHGDIYIALTNTVNVYSSSGVLLGSLDGSATPDGDFNRAICGVAVDASSGDVYIADLRNESDEPRIWRYAPTTPASPIADSGYTVTGIAPGEQICRLAADESHGRLYGASGGGEVTKALLAFPTSGFAASAPPVVSESLDQPVTAVAVDPTNGQVYADEGDRISVFDPSGTPLYHFGYAADFSSESAGVAVASDAPGAATSVYVSDPADGTIAVFGVPTLATTLTHPLLASIGPDGTSAGVFGNLGRLAFDQVTRTLYATDEGTPHGIYEFDASSPPALTPLSGFAPFDTADPGAQPGLAVDNTSLSSAGNLYLATFGGDSLIYGFDSTGTPLGGSFPIDPSTNPGPPDGSPTELCGAAVDSAGRLFVANAETKRILEYGPTGAFLGSIDTSAQSGGPCGLAFATNGDLYASLIKRGIWRYTAASGYTSATRVAPGDGEGQNPPIAVDPSTGHLFVARFRGDPGLPTRTWIEEYGSSGNLLDEFEPGGGVAEIAGITVDSVDHDLYVTDRVNQQIRVIGPGAIFPEASITSASSLTNVSATLGGSVNTQGVALTGCHFEYVTEAAFRVTGFADLSSGGSAPCSPAVGSVPTDLEDHSVTGVATGLSRNTDYRFRLSVANINGTTTTGNQSFPRGGPRIPHTTGSPIRTATTARLDSRVDPRDALTSVHFEYGSQGPCDANPCTATAPVSAGSADLTRLVSQQITGLQPNTTYHYRILAGNGNPDGPVTGEEMTLTTRVSDAPLEHGAFAGPPGSDRAWEQVNPPDTGGNPVIKAQAISDDGERAVYQVAGGTPISDGGNNFTQLLAERTSTGWQAGPAMHPSRAQTVGSDWTVPIANADLSTLFAENIGEGGDDLWRLIPGGEKTKLVADQEMNSVYVSEDASRVVVSLRGSQDPEHPFTAQPGTSYLYDVTSGTPRLISFLPDQSVPACGVVAGAAGFAIRNFHWISPDGSLVFFTSQGDSNCGGASQIYMRDLGAGTTTQISPEPLSGPSCQPSFIRSIPGAVFFWSQSRLASADSAPARCGGAEGGDVYRYDLTDGTLKCLTCLVPGLDTDVSESTPFAAESIGVAGDGSRVYFESASHLLPGTPPQGESAIYRVTVATGALAYVAPGDGAIVGESPGFGRSALNPDGSVLVFHSANPALDALTDTTNAGTDQYYVYDDSDRSLICISCLQDGSAPRGGVPNLLIASDGGDPGEAAPNTTMLDTNGDVFFSTPTALVPGDKNTAGPGEDPESGVDIYEWRDGRPLLVSDGASSWPTPNPGGLYSIPRLSGVTPSGHDVFFTEAAQLTPDAIDGFNRLYDARIGGGFEFPVAKPPCSLEECQGVPAPAPEDPLAATLTFQGPGNQAAPPPPLPVKCGKGDVLRGGRCAPVSCPKKEVRRNGRCVPVPCPKKKVRRNGKCVYKAAARNHRRHTAARPVRSHR